MKIVSLFSSCGGLDLGFTSAGFGLAFANDNDKDVWETFELNHKKGILDKRSLTEIPSEDVPEATGIVGGPPCQSWILAGAMRGAKDSRGQLFYEYIRLLQDKKPKFFLAENVPGIISKTHLHEFLKLLEEFKKIGYAVSYNLLDARNYGVPQERRRVIIVGYENSLKRTFEFPEPTHSQEDWLTLKDSIGNLPEPLPAKEKNAANGASLKIPNHEYMIGGFSTMYMSRNRRRNWDEQSYTIQAGGRHAPLHPSSTKMVKVEADKWKFDDSSGEPKYRRLSVRECARIQTFPDDFIFKYNNVSKGYKMVGNAVPVKLAEALAGKIMGDLKGLGY